MVNSFFISEDYITLLEASAIDGNVHATMYKLNSKTHKLLGYKQGVLKKPTLKNEIQQQIDLICDTMLQNKISFSEALVILNIPYHTITKKMSNEQIVQVSDTRKKYKVSYAKRKYFYN